jgi:CNT family concentrative nucleoside transporter
MIGSIAFGLFGLVVLLGIAFAFSMQRGQVAWKLVGAGIGLQLVFAILVILVPGGREFFDFIAHFFVKIIGFAMQGAQFIFGDLARADAFGFVFAFQVLPTIIFFASLMAVLYHLGIMQKIVQGMAWVMQKIMDVSGSESLSVAANVFVGQTEAPLVVRP